MNSSKRMHLKPPSRHSRCKIPEQNLRGPGLFLVTWRYATAVDEGNPDWDNKNLLDGITKTIVVQECNTEETIRQVLSSYYPRS